MDEAVRTPPSEGLAPFGDSQAFARQTRPQARAPTCLDPSGRSPHSRELPAR